MVEELWKLAGKVIHKRIQEALVFHPCVHGFRKEKGTGTGTAILEVKLFTSIERHMREKHFSVFLDLTKAYDSISRSRLLDILTAYGLGPNIEQLLITYWELQ